MTEYGGYLQAECNHGAHYHAALTRVNSGRNAIWLIVQQRGYRKVFLPYYICDAVIDRLKGVELSYYSIDERMKPVGLKHMAEDAVVLLINYFGMYKERELLQIKEQVGNLIVDNTQSFFQKPVAGIDTVYTCRKYFGVADGAYLSANGLKVPKLERGTSLEAMRFLFGRMEDSAQEHYAEFSANERRLDREDVRGMSLITENMLSGIDYEYVRAARERNYAELDGELAGINHFPLKDTEGFFMYPFYHPRGAWLKKELIAKKIFIPTLWPNVLQLDKERLEYRLAEQMVLLPIDQRYDISDMQIIAQTVKGLLGNGN